MVAVAATVSDSSLVRGTLRSLLAPRRLAPLVLVCALVVVVQAIYSIDPLAIPIGVVMCAAFVAVAPVSWRVLFPEGLDLSHGAIRMLLYGTVGSGVVLIVGAVVPKVLEMGDTLLTSRPGLVACAALFLVGGWGLGRDIQFEASLAREKARTAAFSREAERAQLLAVRAHLDPHFLFNTLNAIAEWCREDGETAERAVLQLSSLLRAVLAGVKNPSWSLGRELELVRALFALHLLRDPSRFSVEIAPPPESAEARALAELPVPPMLLLPLVENAVKHGPAAGHAGKIALELTARGDELFVRIENPGPYHGPRAGSEGLPTVEKRLELAYEGRASLRIGPRDGAGGSDGNERTLVELRLPRSGPTEGAAI